MEGVGSPDFVYNAAEARRLGLTPGRYLVYLYVKYRCKESPTGAAVVTLTATAEATGMSMNGARSALSALSNRGLLETAAEPPRGRRGTEYRMTRKGV